LSNSAHNLQTKKGFILSTCVIMILDVRIF